MINQSLLTSHRRDRSRASDVGRIRRRRYAMTLNNPTALDCVLWNSIILDGNDAEHASNLTFFVVQTEKGDNGTIHYQAYCEFKKAVGLNEVKAIFGSRVHCQGAFKNANSNIRYCTKNDTRFTGEDVCIAGQWGSAKSRGNIMQAALKILDGADATQIMDEHPDLMLLHFPKIESFIAYAKGPRLEKPKITILYGITGSGKSQYCVNLFGAKAYWVSPPSKSGVWWGHYTGQDVCVFDDFHAGWFKLTVMLRLLDSTPLMVAPKGGQVPFNSAKLIFTSNVDPCDWYSSYEGKKAHKDALERRLQDFAEIIDCEMIDQPTGMGHTVRVMERTKRTETFKFRDDYGLNLLPAGVGDMSQGNGF